MHRLAVLLTFGMTLPVSVDLPSTRFGLPIEATAYLVINEALTNVVKHARGTRASVWGRARDGELHIEVADDGVGGADAGTSSGLAGLEDRVSALGGRLIVISLRGEGTRVIAALPLPDQPVGVATAGE